jgi:hypothetical protein
MHGQVTDAADALTRYFETGSSGPAGAVPRSSSAYRAGITRGSFRTKPAEPDEALYIPTQAGRDLVARLRAQEALFSDLWPTCAEAVAG